MTKKSKSGAKSTNLSRPGKLTAANLLEIATGAEYLAEPVTQFSEPPPWANMDQVQMREADTQDSNTRDPQDTVDGSTSSSSSSSSSHCNANSDFYHHEHDFEYDPETAQFKLNVSHPVAEEPWEYGPSMDKLT